MKKGIDVVEFIQRNHLEDAVVTVTATVYRNGDHDCNTTDNVSIMQSTHYDYEKKTINDGKYLMWMLLDDFGLCTTEFVFAEKLACHNASRA